jgi:hypothetical protein
MFHQYFTVLNHKEGLVVVLPPRNSSDSSDSNHNDINEGTSSSSNSSSSSGGEDWVGRRYRTLRSHTRVLHLTDLWRLAANALHPLVGDAAVERLVDLHFNLEKRMAGKVTHRTPHTHTAYPYSTHNTQHTA